MFLNIKGSLMDLSRPKVMGIINVTEDSFFDKSRCNDMESLTRSAAMMLENGADILDIGGCSTRPGADLIEPEEELKRVRMAVTAIRKRFPEAVISVDTFRACVAKEAVKSFGADIINDISGGELDPEMLPLIIEMNVPFILMHMQGTPANMQKNPVYNDVVADILMWLEKRVSILKQGGVKDVIIDPGFGFGKTPEQNFEILRRFDEFHIAGLPLLAGLSRKSMIWKSLDITPSDALNGTTGLNMVALMKGANILRVHDVMEAVEVVALFEKIYPGGISFNQYC
jgi:dihydropteroate synthase